jgi:hypothetical protein
MSVIPEPTQEDVADIALYASLVRTIERAPVEKKLAVFQLMAGVAVDSLNAHRQAVVDDLWLVADKTELVKRLGEGAVQTVLRLAFERCAA